MIVADATLLAHLALPVAPASDQALARAVFQRDGDWRMPPLWRSEVRHVTWKYVRGGYLDLAIALAALSTLDRLVGSATESVSHEDVLRAADSLGLSAYDAEYAALAERLGCPLVTSDRALQKASPQAISPDGLLQR